MFRPLSLDGVDASLFTSRSRSLSDQTLCGGKRLYLADYMQLTNSSYLVAQLKSVAVKSILLQGVLSGNKYTRHLERQVAAEQHGETIEDFDAESAKKEFAKGCEKLLIRNTWNLLLRKFYERIFVGHVDIRLADRLTKDVLKSSLRKLQKYSSTEAACRSFFTGMYANCLPSLALFTVDCGYGLHETLVERSMGFTNIRFSDILFATRWVLRRLTMYSFVTICSSAGVAMGTYFNASPKVSTPLIAALCEAVGQELYILSVGRFICCM